MLAKRLRQSILKARSLRRTTARVGARQSRSDISRLARPVAKGKAPEGDELQSKARKANIVTSRLLGRLLKVKTRIEMSLLSPDLQLGPFREALEELTFAADAPASNRWPAGVSLNEESVLDALDRFEMLLNVAPGGSDEIELSATLRNGQYCDQVIDEIRRVRHLYRASTVGQIKSAHPRFAVWSMIEGPDMDAEDRDVFFHPGRWGPVVGYAIKILARHFGKSEETIKRWRKAYKRHVRTVPDRTTQKTGRASDPV
jgi:hypothetical protein